MPILREYYDTGGNWDYEIYGSEWKGQTFTTSSAYTLTNVSLKLARSGTPGTLTVSIFATSSGKPTGSALTSNTYDGNSLSDSVYTWIDIQLTPYSLSSGVQYAIVVKATSGDSSNFVYWLAESGMPDYDGGSQVWSSNSGSSWTKQGNNDQYFRTYSAQNITFGEYIGAGSSTTKLLLYLNGNSTDSSGNGNNGTDTNATYSLANGKLGQGVLLNANGKIAGTFPPITGNFTINLWTKRTGTGSVGSNYFNDAIIDIGSYTANTGFGIWCAAEDAATPGQISWRINKTYNNYAAINYTLPLNTYVMVSVVYNGSNVTTYINGSQISQIAHTTNPSSATTWSLGWRENNNEYYQGCIDEVFVENRAWTATEIKKYYTYSLGRF